MLFRSSHRLQRGAIVAALILAVIACAPPPPSAPRPTAQTIIEITVAPTQNIDATATVYAKQLIPTPTPAGLYKVQQGDTLSGIADQFDTTVDELAAANGLTDANAIQVGQSLLIPALLSQTLTLSNTTGLSGTQALTATAVLGTPTPTPKSP